MKKFNIFIFSVIVSITLLYPQKTCGTEVEKSIDILKKTAVEHSRDNFASVYSIDEIEPDFHASHYNSLPPIEKADEDIKSKTFFQAFLNRAGEIIRSHKLEDYVGVRLIHRHFSLNAGQVMVEKFEQIDSVPSLVTSAEDISLAREKGAVPSGWIFSKSNPVVFEFSTDLAVKDGLALIQNSLNFLREMREVIEEFKLEELMAVGVLKKQSVVAEGDQIYWERNYYNSNLSIVQLSDPFEPVKTETMFWTAWRFISEGPITRCVMCYGCAVAEDCGANHH